MCIRDSSVESHRLAFVAARSASRALLRQQRRRRPCVRGGVVHLTPGKWPTPAVTPTSRPKPRGVSNAIDRDALRWHGLVRRGSPAETRPARWNLVDARTTSDGGTDGQAYVQGSWKATPTARTGCRASEAWPRRSPFPARAYVFGTQASETASHSSQIERLFLARIATGRPWPLAKNLEFRRGARRPSDAAVGAKPGFLVANFPA